MIFCDMWFTYILRHKSHKFKQEKQDAFKNLIPSPRTKNSPTTPQWYSGIFSHNFLYPSTQKMLFSLSFLPPSQMTLYYTHYSSVFFYIEEHIGDARDAEFNPRVRKILWRRKWLPTPVFLPGESHGQRSLAGYSQSMGSQRDTTEHAHVSHSRQNYLLCNSCVIFNRFATSSYW